VVEAARIAEATWDGASPRALGAELGLPRVEVYTSIGSTLDVAHAVAAAGASAGTLVLADAQSAGRGRLGRSWISRPGQGIWLTLVERPADADALDVVSLRIGLAAARVLDDFAPERVSLKWPNDLYVGGRKLAGILVEARWQSAHLEWLAVGFGVNVTPADDSLDAAALRPGVSRMDVLRRLIPALRGAVAERGRLSSAELRAFAARDLACGRAVVEPEPGRVVGIDASGALVLDTPAGRRSIRAGSLVFSPEVV
jgi:BirA family biotin operon repressor/biotin-[acetyl-CoA-carboxylase] ligase